jgi:microcystin-dependent protein
MAYSSDKKPGALTAATVLANTDNVVVEQSGDVKRATLSQVEAKIFDAKTATSTPTGTEAVVVRLTDGNLRQVALSDIVPAGNITNAKVSDSAAIADTKLATIVTGGKVANSATTATPNNNINTIVARDGSGNFSAGTITATLAGSITGNAASASILQTARTIALSGDVTGTATSFNGGANIAIPTAITADSIVNANINPAANIADTKLATIATAGKVLNSATTATSANTNGAIVARDGTGNFSASTITANLTGNVTGNLTGDVTGDVTGNLTGTASAIADGSVSTSKIVDGAVTAGKLAAGAAIPAGAVMPFAMNSAPSGWLAADGTAVSRSTYAALFTAIGTTYGAGDGSTTFALPDLRGIFVRGSGSQTIDGTAYSGTLGLRQGQQLQSHKHRDSDRQFVGLSGFGTWATSTSQRPQYDFNASTARALVSTPTDDNGNFTLAVGTENRPANIALLYCIKF